MNEDESPAQDLKDLSKVELCDRVRDLKGQVATLQEQFDQLTIPRVNIESTRLDDL